MNPKYTIIVPSYNGGEYLKQCVQNVLGQSYGDFELAVLEDGSTDGSLQWLRAVDDARLKVYASPQNLGIVENWARALEIPKGEFMVIVGQDDLLDPDYLQKMDDLIAREPQAALYFSHFRYIDANGHLIRACRALPPRETAAQYIAALFKGERDTYGTGYMMRSTDYHHVGGIPKYKKLLFADDALWISVMHKSWKATAEAECFSIRLHPASVGAGARFDWISAMRCYITFLEKLSSRDADVAKAFRAYGPQYFCGFCDSVYLHGVISATLENRRFAPRSQREIFAQLSRVSPYLSRRLRNSKKVRLYRFINSFALNRQIYLLARFLFNAAKTTVKRVQPK